MAVVEGMGLMRVGEVVVSAGAVVEEGGSEEKDVEGMIDDSVGELLVVELETVGYNCVGSGSGGRSGPSVNLGSGAGCDVDGLLDKKTVLEAGTVGFAPDGKKIVVVIMTVVTALGATYVVEKTVLVTVARTTLCWKTVVVTSANIVEVRVIFSCSSATCLGRIYRPSTVPSRCELWVTAGSVVSGLGRATRNAATLAFGTFSTLLFFARKDVDVTVAV